MSIAITGAIAAVNTVKGVLGIGGTARRKPDFEDILKNFKKVAAQTPAEKVREAVLAKHKLSEEDYQKLPASERKAIDQEIVEAVKKVTERKTGVALADSPWDASKLFG